MGEIVENKGFVYGGGCQETRVERGALGVVQGSATPLSSGRMFGCGNGSGL